MPRMKPRSSRRAPALRDKDYDHEISLVDNAPETDDGFADLLTTGEVLDRRTSVPTVAVTDDADGVTETDGAGDADGDAAGDAAGSGDDAPMTPSATNRLSPAATNGLSPAATASSTTPLLKTTALAAPAVPRGRPHKRYGSISQVASATSAAPSVQVQEATPVSEYPAVETSDAPSDHKSGLDVEAISRQSTQSVQSIQTVQSLSIQTVQSVQSVRREPEEAIDVLYENERGLFLCGVPLFSRQALGNLDPSPWTNASHHASPTDIYTAQVPDPTWEWAWPEWRVNHDAGVDEDGWEYSFMFARCFSWHGASWWRSFVRRRAWIRKRTKRRSSVSVHAATAALGLAHTNSAPEANLLNPDYFTVVSAAEQRRSASRSRSRARRASREANANDDAANDAPDATDDAADADDEPPEMPREIYDMDVLIRFLRAARIDREKIEAVGNYLDHAGADLVRLQDYMHEIMALFVFQASRRVLLTQLTQAHDAAVQAQKTIGLGKGKAKTGTADSTDSTADTDDDTEHVLGRRVAHLTAAVRHADEEVRRLEFWSDIKAMAQHGTAEAVSTDGGWDADRWQGVDQSGPAPPEPVPKAKA